MKFVTSKQNYFNSEKTACFENTDTACEKIIFYFDYFFLFLESVIVLE